MDIRSVTDSDIFTSKIEQLCQAAKEVQEQILDELHNRHAYKLADNYTPGLLSKQKNQLVADFVKRVNRKLGQNPLSHLQNLRSFIEAFQKLNRELTNNEDLSELAPLFQKNSSVDYISIKFFQYITAKEKIIKLEVSWLYTLVGLEREARLDDQNIKDQIISKHDNDLLRKVYNVFPRKIQYCEEKLMAWYMQMLWDEKKMEKEIDDSLAAMKKRLSSPLAILENLQEFLELEGDEFESYKEKTDARLNKIIKAHALEKVVEQYKADYWFGIVRKALEKRKKMSAETIALAMVNNTKERVKAKFETLSESSKACIFRSGDDCSMRQFLYFDRQQVIYRDIEAFKPQEQCILFICRTLLVQAGEQLKIKEKALFWEKFIRNKKDTDSYISNSNLKHNKNDWYKAGYENPGSELMVDELIQDMQNSLYGVEELSDNEHLENFVEEKIAGYLNFKLKIEYHRQDHHASSDNYKKMLLLEWEREMKLFAASLAKDFKLVIKAVQGKPLVIKTAEDTSRNMEKYTIYRELADTYASYHASLQRRSLTCVNMNSHAAGFSGNARSTTRRCGISSFLKWVVTFFAVLFCCTADSEEVSSVKNESKKNSSRVRHVSHVDMYKSMGIPGEVVNKKENRVEIIEPDAIPPVEVSGHIPTPTSRHFSGH